jgi:hypothetical protein
MKIIGHSNFDNEAVADVLVAENVHPSYVEFIVQSLLKSFGGDYATYYFSVVDDDYKLWRGMEEFV